MLASEAWQALSVYEWTLYMEIKRKFNGSNEKNLSLTYREGKALMSKYRFTRAIDRLIEVGLIDLIEHRPQSRRATIYGLSVRWQYFGTEYFERQTRVTSKQYKFT